MRNLSDILRLVGVVYSISVARATFGVGVGAKGVFSLGNPWMVTYSLMASLYLSSLASIHLAVAGGAVIFFVR